MGKNCPKIAENLSSQALSGQCLTLLGHFRTFALHYVMILVFWAVQRFARHKDRRSIDDKPVDLLFSQIALTGVALSGALHLAFASGSFLSVVLQGAPPPIALKASMCALQAYFEFLMLL